MCVDISDSMDSFFCVRVWAIWEGEVGEGSLKPILLLLCCEGWWLEEAVVGEGADISWESGLTVHVINEGDVTMPEYSKGCSAGVRLGSFLLSFMLYGVVALTACIVPRRLPSHGISRRHPANQITLEVVLLPIPSTFNQGHFVQIRIALNIIYTWYSNKYSEMQPGFPQTNV
jgi:hypothetical protein